MTNTRATDPEVLESRLPLRVCRFSLRAGSGSAGTHRGRDGLVRELELRRGGVWTAWDGARVALSAGDRVRVGTPGGGGWSRGERLPTR